MTATLALITGCVLTGLGLGAMLLQPSLLRKLLGFNVMGGGVFLLIIALSPRMPDGTADPIAQALVLTGIVISVAATALGLRLVRAWHALDGNRSHGDEAPDDD